MLHEGLWCLQQCRMQISQWYLWDCPFSFLVLDVILWKGLRPSISSSGKRQVVYWITQVPRLFERSSSLKMYTFILCPKGINKKKNLIWLFISHLNKPLSFFSDFSQIYLSNFGIRWFVRSLAASTCTAPSTRTRTPAAAQRPATPHLSSSGF